MSCGLPGRYDPASILAGQRHNHEQHLAVSHSDYRNPLLAIGVPGVDLFHAVRVFDGSNGIGKVHAVLAKVFGGFGIVRAIGARANYLVSRDKDLLSIGEHGNIKIVAPETSLAVLRQSGEAAS
jgi:hypothetical protein